MLDIVIPVLNEEKILIELKDYYLKLKKNANLIFVDGQSTDQTRVIAEEYGRVVTTSPGRAYQKNYGAAQSSARYLLFLHVDALVDISTLNKIPQILDNEVSCGHFTLHIDDSRWIFRIYERCVNWRAKKFYALDGDLGLFIDRQRFFKLDQFHRKPIMEDILFSKKIKNKKLIIMLDETICVSSRKWDEEGFCKTFFKYSLAYVQLWTGIKFFKDQNEKK